MKVFSLFNIKGGVGKTTAAINLAYLSSIEGARTLIIDLDPQAAATFYLRIKPKFKGGAKSLVKKRVKLDSRIKGTDFEGLDLLPADLTYRKLELYLDKLNNPEKRLRMQLKPLRKHYDRVFIDCGPGVSLVAESVFRSSNVLLVPTIPTPLSMRTLSQLERHLTRQGFFTRATVMPFFTMVDRRKTLHRSICSDPGDFRVRFLETAIPSSSLVEKMGFYRKPLPVYSPRSLPTEAFQSLWEEIKSRCPR